MTVITPVNPKRKFLSRPAGRQMTQAEFHLLPEGPPFYELFAGELVEMVKPRLHHQEIVGELYFAIKQYLHEQKLGKVWLEIMVDITPTSTYIPDLTFLLFDHFGQIEHGQKIIGPPDLVVEVISPSTGKRDRSTKLNTYFAAGVPWFWLVEEDLVILEYHWTEEGYLVNQSIEPYEEFEPALFPGLKFNLAALIDESKAVIAEENNDE